MILKLFYYCLILLLLQSCSGGRIGNFLELSFSNIEEEKSISNGNNSISKKVITKNKNSKDSIKNEISQTNKDFSKATKETDLKTQNLKFEETNNIKKVIKKNIIQNNNKKIKSNYDPQSYRVTIILREVDPTAPSQKFSNVLKNANIIFEIEKIERF